ncbi:kelch domain-containing protein 3-like isoform X2 [Stegodyphus dumicola]|uniref:kelch domain-containing protein 3-like isoform X2 n=1 Tax=Stegodyphus dumicola TaxID=202533 RepID=UPI0015AF676A|nr:kelch domain-containing protein 3-like isoform X2 [Stegodyphus dumicola]
MYWTVHLEGGPQRVNHAAVAVGHKIYSFGGYCSGEGFEVIGKIDVHVLDTDTLRWCPVHYTEAQAAPFKRYGHAVVEYKGKIYLWGGRNDLNASNILHCFDVDDRSWSIPVTGGNIPKSVDGHSACVIGDYMYIFGGYEEEAEKLVQTLYRLNFNTFNWEEVITFGDPPSSRDFHTASAIGNCIYIFGGRSSENMLNGQIEPEFYCNKIVYLNTQSMKWVTPEVYGIPPCGRRSHSAAVYENELYIIGGYNALTQEHHNDIYKFSPEKNAWIEMHAKGDGPCPRRRHCSCVVGNRLFLFGGSSPPSDESIFLDISEGFQKLIDHSDLYVLDFFPSLKTLCQLKIIDFQLNINRLPRFLMQEIRAMTTNNNISRNDFFPRKDFGVFVFSA